MERYLKSIDRSLKTIASELKKANEKQQSLVQNEKKHKAFKNWG